MAGRNQSSRGQKPVHSRIGHYWRTKGPFVALSMELLDSDAYRTLTATQQSILVDMLRKFYDVSDNDEEILPRGFTYTYRECRVLCSDKTHSEALKEFERRRFIRCPPELQLDGLTTPIRYMPFASWRHWSDPEKIQKHEAQKRARLKSWERNIKKSQPK